MTAATQHHGDFTTFLHLTVDTGHCSAAHSRSVTSDVRKHFAPLVARALESGDAVPVALISPDAFMRMKREDGAYYVEMLARTNTGFTTVVAFGVSLVPGQGRRLWQRLHAESFSPQASITYPTEKPWIGARLAPEAMYYPHIVFAAGEFEQAIAWTLVTHVQPRTASVASKDDVVMPSSQCASPVPKSIPETDGLVFDCNSDQAPTLFVYLSSPTDDEIADIRRGTAKFALTKHGALSFVLAKFGRFEWMDAPFHAGLYPPETQGMPREWRPGARMALAVVIVDRNTGQQRGARLLSLSPHFWDTFAVQVKRQIAAPVVQPAYHAAIDNAYQTYPTSDAMVKHALATSKAGD